MRWLKRLFGTDQAKAPSAPARPDKDPESPEAMFSHEVAARATCFEGVDRVERDDANFALNVWLEGSEAPHVMYLGNLFREARDRSPDDRVEVVERFLRSLMISEDDVSVDWEEARERLVPVLRSQLMLMHTKDVAPVHRPILPTLAVFVVLDFDERMMFVVPKHLSDWQKDADEVLAAALARFGQRAHAVEAYGKEGEALWHIANDDTYDSSRLLVPGLLAALEQKWGKLAFAIPDRASMLFAPVADAQAIARLQDVASREFDAAPRALSPDLYVVEGSKTLAPLQVDREHPVAEALYLRRVQFAMAEHDAQKELLSARLEAEGADIFVASVLGARNNVTDEMYTYGTWVEDVDTLLAKTDYVIVGVGDPETPEFSHFRVSWDRLLQIVGDGLVRTDEYGLPRWRTQRWLRHEELESLRSLAEAD